MFIGRTEYLDDLCSLWKKRAPSFVACRGRRRIGKSTLFREFAKRTAQDYIEIEGLPPSKFMDNQQQLDGFMEALASQTGMPCGKVDNWYAAFHWLDRAIDDRKRTVVLLDEISWMGSFDKNFPGRLRSAWETFFHRHEKLILVICGSASAWIKENILDNTGFAGRLSRDYVLTELPLSDCIRFWGKAAERIETREILDVLSVTGGVPRYLEEVDPGLSADENIRRLCFLEEGVLYKDFDAMFAEVFGGDTVERRRILECLTDGPRSAVEVAEQLKIENNGHLSAQLRSLEEAGLLSSDVGKNPATGKDARISKYRMRDNYVRFYLRYIAPHQTEIKVGSFRFSSVSMLPGWNAILGLQFENLVVNNLPALVPLLGIGSGVILSAAPYRNMRKAADGGTRGLQIDLLIQTARTAYVVEIKRKRYIDESVENEVEHKVRLLPLRKGVSARPVLVYDGELDPVVLGNGYFDAVIPARRLLGL
ncbi:MAG: helix-turn-helix domain-containing protein [Kiritimatiellae bacterium]|nr:helix-turn-helix domain-containing protein [Kiritimatiellia bacterium]